MEQVTLQFHNMQELWEFQKVAQLRNFQFNALDCSLQALFTNDELWEVLTKWGCTIVERK
jgi:hypothetical protein